jgi:hypothetical protein
MNAVYDHMVAIVFIGIMFVWAVSVVPQMSFNSIQAVNQQQLRNMELNVFNSLLLDTGSAVNGSTNTKDWGSITPFSQNAVTRFGLSSVGESTLFTLDPDKVQRLTDNPLGSISYERTKQLLGLEGYNFIFQILPPFNVTNADGTKIDMNNSPIDVWELQNDAHPTLAYQARIVFLDGRPIPNATVQSTAIYTEGTNFEITGPITSKSNEMGIAHTSAALAFKPSSIMVIMKVSVADVATIVVTFGQILDDIVDINIVGDQVTLTEPKAPNNGAVWLMDMYYYSIEGGAQHLYTGGKDNANKLNTGSGEFLNWTRNFNGLKSLDPVVMILNVYAVPDNGELPENGRQDLVVAGPYQNLLGYTVFEYGPSNPGLSTIVSSQRSVIISGMTYTAQFILWKESE